MSTLWKTAIGWTLAALLGIGLGLMLKQGVSSENTCNTDIAAAADKVIGNAADALDIVGNALQIGSNASLQSASSQLQSNLPQAQADGDSYKEVKARCLN